MPAGSAAVPGMMRSCRRKNEGAEAPQPENITAWGSGVDIRTVSGMLGHADPGFTLRTYTHTSNPMQVKAAETIGNIMGKKL